MHPGTGIQHAVKSKVKQQLQIRYFLTYCIALCLANCYNQKRFLDQNAHEAFGDRGPQREHTALSELAGFKGKGPFCGRKPKEGQGRDKGRGGIIALPPIPGSATTQLDSSWLSRMTTMSSAWQWWTIWSYERVLRQCWLIVIEWDNNIQHTFIFIAGRI